MATNAGGLRVLRWGPARAQLVGAEAVLASGAVLSRVDGPVKDSTGYDLSGLLCGSEGTLGVLTRVRLRLVPPLPAERAVAVVGVRVGRRRRARCWPRCGRGCPGWPRPS